MAPYRLSMPVWCMSCGAGGLRTKTKPQNIYKKRLPANKQNNGKEAAGK